MVRWTAATNRATDAVGHQLLAVVARLGNARIETQCRVQLRWTIGSEERRIREVAVECLAEHVAHQLIASVGREGPSASNGLHADQPRRSGEERVDILIKIYPDGAATSWLHRTKPKRVSAVEQAFGSIRRRNKFAAGCFCSREESIVAFWCYRS